MLKTILVLILIIVVELIGVSVLLNAIVDSMTKKRKEMTVSESTFVPPPRKTHAQIRAEFDSIFCPTPRKTPNMIRREMGFPPLAGLDQPFPWDYYRVQHILHTRHMNDPGFYAYTPPLVTRLEDALSEIDTLKLEADKHINQIGNLDWRNRKLRDDVTALKTVAEAAEVHNRYGRGVIEKLSVGLAVAQEENKRLTAFKTFADHVSSLPGCNDCGAQKHCPYVPKLGENVRFNCPIHIKSLIPSIEMTRNVGLDEKTDFKKEN